MGRASATIPPSQPLDPPIHVPTSLVHIMGVLHRRHSTQALGKEATHAI